MSDQRGLSERQAAACENATTPRCRCRCGGALHGVARGEVRTLPREDPHHPANTERSSPADRHWEEFVAASNGASS